MWPITRRGRPEVVCTCFSKRIQDETDASDWLQPFQIDSFETGLQNVKFFRKLEAFFDSWRTVIRKSIWTICTVYRNPLSKVNWHCNKIIAVMSMRTILVFHTNFINSKEIIAMYKKCVKSSEKTHCLKICCIYLTFRCERFEHVTC